MKSSDTVFRDSRFWLAIASLIVLLLLMLRGYPL